MKKIIIIITLFISGNLIAQTGTIELTVSGINLKKGKNIKIAIYDEIGFLKEIKIQKTIQSKGKEIIIKLDDIEVGKYAIAVFQDENSDGKMNTNFMGKPKELSGFSNDAKGDFGPPEFNDASFDVFNDKSTKLVIHLMK
ncbi:MAG TPA: DUF2141 domain-containing protein [Bacteroidia bacterium]|nr:DUF2141 domain-containing protein [Bacteroidia bacterium]